MRSPHRGYSARSDRDGFGRARCSGAFYPQAFSCPATLAVGQSCNISIRFCPTAAGTATGSLTIPTGAGTLTAPLTGTGTETGTPTLSAVSALSSRADGSYAVSVTVTNSGTGTAPDAVLTGLLLGDIAGAPLPQTLGDIVPGQSARVTVIVPASPSLPHTLAVESFTGTYIGGTFGGSFRTRLP